MLVLSCNPVAIGNNVIFGVFFFGAPHILYLKKIIFLKIETVIHYCMMYHHTISVARGGREVQTFCYPVTDLNLITEFDILPNCARFP